MTADGHSRVRRLLMTDACGGLTLTLRYSISDSSGEGDDDGD